MIKIRLSVAIAALAMLSACTKPASPPPASGNPPVFEDPCPRPDGRPCQ